MSELVVTAILALILMTGALLDRDDELELELELRDELELLE